MERKRYPKEFKDQLIQEVKEINNAIPVAQKHGINVKTLYRWIQESKHKAWEQTPREAKKVSEYIPSPQEFRQLEEENHKLKNILGEKDLEIAIMRDMIKKRRPGFQTK